MKGYVVRLNVGIFMKTKKSSKALGGTAAVRKSFNEIGNSGVSINGLLLANWKATCSLGTLNHASAAGVVKRIKAVIRRKRM